jgi:hypothetical protein
MAGQQQGVFKKSHAIQQALIAAASMGYTEVRYYDYFTKLCIEGPRKLGEKIYYFNVAKLPAK